MPKDVTARGALMMVLVRGMTENEHFTPLFVIGTVKEGEGVPSSIGILIPPSAIEQLNRSPAHAAYLRAGVEGVMQRAFPLPGEVIPEQIIAPDEEEEDP